VIVEAKKLTIGPQNVLTQAERYARGLSGNSFDFDGVLHDVRYGRTPVR
jgi:type I restriction enzyme R subunit